MEGSSRELGEPLRGGVLDMMIGALREVEPLGLVQQPLFKDSLAMIGRACHPLAGRDVDPAALTRFGHANGIPPSEPSEGLVSFSR